MVAPMVAPVALIALLLPSAFAFVPCARLLVTAAPRLRPIFALVPSSSLPPDLTSSLQPFKDSPAVITGILSAITIRVVIREVRYRIEKPVMDQVGQKAREELTPNTEQVGPVEWAKLAGCIVLDLAGASSELYGPLGEFMDLAYAPVEAGMLFVLFKSRGIAKLRGGCSSPWNAATHRSRSPGLP